MLYLPKVSPRQSSRTTVHTPVHFGLQPVFTPHTLMLLGWVGVHKPWAVCSACRDGSDCAGSGKWTSRQRGHILGEKGAPWRGPLSPLRGWLGVWGQGRPVASGLIPGEPGRQRI